MSSVPTAGSCNLNQYTVKPISSKKNLTTGLPLPGLLRQVHLQDLFDTLPRLQILTDQAGIGRTVPRGAEQAASAWWSEPTGEPATGAAGLKGSGHVLHTLELLPLGVLEENVWLAVYFLLHRS